MSDSTDRIKPSFKLLDWVIYILKLGTWGFSGPVTLIGITLEIQETNRTSNCSGCCANRSDDLSIDWALIGH